MTVQRPDREMALDDLGDQHADEPHEIRLNGIIATSWLRFLTISNYSVFWTEEGLCSWVHTEWAMSEENRALANYLGRVTVYGPSPEKIVGPEKNVDEIVERNEELPLDEVFSTFTYDGTMR